MDLFLFAVGFIGFIAALIFLIISLIKKKPKKIPLIALGVCFVLFAIGLSMDGNKDGEIAVGEEVEENMKDDQEKIEKQDPDESEEDKEEKKAKEEKKKAEDRKRKEEEKEKKLKKEEAKKKAFKDSVKPWYDSIVKKYDDDWDNLWSGTWNNIADGSISADKAIANLDKLRDDELYKLDKYIEEYKIPDDFGTAEINLIKGFQENMGLAVDTRITAATEGLLGLDGTIDLDVEIIQETIKRGDSYMLQGVANIVELKQKLDLLDAD